VQLKPELTDLGLGFGYRCPVVDNVLVFAADLAAVATVANTGID
jgi:hypothetical protein